MTTLYRTILFAALAGYGWYYNGHLNIDSPASSPAAKLHASRLSG